MGEAMTLQLKPHNEDAEISIRFVTGPYIATYADILDENLDRCKKIWEKLYTKSSLLDEFIDGKRQLWIGYRDEDPELFMVSVIHKYPIANVLLLDWLFGKNLRVYMPYFNVIENYAMSVGCNYIEFRTRPVLAAMVQEKVDDVTVHLRKEVIPVNRRLH